MDTIFHLQQTIENYSSLDKVPVLRDAAVAYLTEQESLAQIQWSWEAWKAELYRCLLLEFCLKREG